MEKILITVVLMTSLAFGMRTGSEATNLNRTLSKTQLAEELEKLIDSIQKEKEQEELERKWKMIEKVLGEIVDEMEEDGN